MTWAFGRQTPDNNLMRFVARRFSKSAIMLDIGSGEGANARELAARGHRVDTVDINPKCMAVWMVDICELELKEKSFDLIYDINTLCHVENPPFEKIKGWLKPDGIFFLICPTERSWRGIAEGKDFTRFARHSELRDMLGCFSSVKIDEAFVPDFWGHYLESWIVEARP